MLTFAYSFQGSKSAPSFALPQAAPAPPVFGDVSTTNGSAVTTSTDTPRPFGFGFSGAKPENQPRQDQNLFFQCMSQNSGSSPSLTTGPTQSKDTNYFTAVSESLGKETPSLFKPLTPLEGLKKPEPPKVPETHPTGNGVPNKSSPAFQGMGSSAAGRGTTAIGGLAAVPVSQNNPKKAGNNGTCVVGLGLQSGFSTSNSHQNLFLQATKEPTNPFLAYGEKTTHTSFAGLSGSEPQARTGAPDRKTSLFIMSEPAKGILPSPLLALSASTSPSSSSSPAPTSSQRSQSEVAVPKEECEASEMPSSTSGCPTFGHSGADGMDEVPASFDQSQSQKFSLEERGQSSKRDSDSSSNSDLSDLSENEEGPEKGQMPGGPQNSKDGVLAQKSKVSVAAKGRPRNKPFKGKLLSLSFF